MKKSFLLSAIVAIFAITASAQIKKGAMLLGGQLSYGDSKRSFNSTQADETVKSGLYNILVGTALKENFILGGYVRYGHFKINNSNNLYSNTKEESYSAGVFIRQYKKIGKDFYFFGELGGGYLGANGSQTTTSPSVITKYEQSGGNLYLSPGISYRIYKKLQVELAIPQLAAVSYLTQKNTAPANGSKENLFQFNTNLNSSFLSNLGLGFRFVL